MIVYRGLAAMLWLGVLIAVLSVLVAGSLVLIVGAVVVGFALPSRTVRGQLRSLYVNAREGIAHVQALQR